MKWIIEQESDSPDIGWIFLAETDEWQNANDIGEAMEEKFRIRFRVIPIE